MRRIRPGLVALFLACSLSAWAAKQTAPTAPVRRLFNKTARPLATGPIVRISGYSHMSQGAYKDLRNASIALMKVHPPDKSVYIGLGRDPAPFVAFLQEIGADAVNFPASGGSFAASPELDRHFDKLIPKKYLTGGKTLVLIDQTRSGKTHNSMMPLLKDWLKRTGQNVRVTGVAYNSASTITYGRIGVKVINTTPFPEVFKFFYSPYEGVVSPFNRHVPGSQTVEQLTPRAGYDRFRGAIRRRIERDAVLDRFLAAFVGPKPTAVSRAKAWNLKPIYQAQASDLGKAATLTLGDPHNGHGVLTQGEYDDLSWGAQQLLERHTPEGGRFYLGAGRSASPLVAFLENLGAEVGYLATDGLRAGNSRLNPAWAKTFTARLAEAIPKQVLKSGAPITIFQHAGQDAAALKRLVEGYVRKTKSKSPVQIVTFNGQGNANADSDNSTIVTRGHAALQQLNGVSFAPMAQYAYHPGESLPPSDYGKLKTAIKDRMERDKTLDAFLGAPEF